MVVVVEVWFSLVRQTQVMMRGLMKEANYDGGKGVQVC